MTFQFRADLTETGAGVRARVNPDSRAAWCDDDPMSEHGAGGFAAEARIDTPYGPVPAGMLRAGHRVLTQGAGPQTVRWVGRRRVVGRGQAAPVHVPAGTLGATGHVRVAQQHRVLLSGQMAERLIGLRDVLVPAAALVGQGGIHIAACEWVTYVYVLLEAHHVICAEGVTCESLFIGPISADPLGRVSRILPDGEESAIRHRSFARPVLGIEDARDVLNCDHMPEDGKALEPLRYSFMSAEGPCMG